MPSALDSIAASFGRARVHVAGDVMLDEYLYGIANRISPEAPVPVVELKSRRHVAGGAGNVAANVASLGARVSVLGICGVDDNGRLLRSVLDEAGVDHSGLLAREGRPTTCKMRVVAGQQQIVRCDMEERSTIGFDNTLFERFEALLDASDICVLSDYGKGVLSEEFCRRAIALAGTRGKALLADPKGREFDKYVGATLITPNQREACEATGQIGETEEHVLAAGAALLERLPGSSVLITRGPEGMTLFRPGLPALTIPTVARTVFDVVGAGDTAIAALSVSLAAGLSFETSIRLANVAAGIAVARHGTTTVGIGELLERATSLGLLPEAREPAYV